MPKMANDGLPVATPIFYDFPMYDRSGWEVTPEGFVHPIPYAVAAKVDPPVGFPNVPQKWRAHVQEAVDGLYEVANILESLGMPPEVEQDYRDILYNLEAKFQRFSSDKEVNTELPSDKVLNREHENAISIVKICEDTAYDIEALIGAVQVLEEKCLDEVYGIERVGIFYTFRCYSFDQNYNLNLIMMQWIRRHWGYPYATDQEVKALTLRYGFEPFVIETWLSNAREMVWAPLSKIKSTRIGTESNVANDENVQVQNCDKNSGSIPALRLCRSSYF